MATRGSSTQRNLLPNPSFESGGDRPAGWRFHGEARLARQSWAAEGAHSGARCLAFFPPMQQAAWECEPVALSPGRPYGLIWWTRFSGGEPWHWSYHSEFVGVVVRFFDSAGSEVGNEKRKFHCLQTAEWQQAWVKFAPPQGAALATVEFAYRTGIEPDGRVWVDDVELEPLEPLPPAPAGCARLIMRVLDGQNRAARGRMWVRAAGGEYLFPKYCYRFAAPDIGFHAAPQDSWLDVPAGQVTVGARRGFEYAPVEQTLRLEPGETREIVLVLRRTADMPAAGWFCGDHHSHLFFHKSTQHPQMRPQEAFEIAKAEGLNYLSLDGEMIEFRANLEDHDKARDDEFVGEMGLEAVTDFYGHICLVNVRQDLPGGFPMRMVFWPTNEMVQEYVVNQGGAVIAAHPLNGIPLERFFEAVADPHRGCLARELALDVLLGRNVCYDVYSEISPPQRIDDVLAVYYHLLNLGRRVGISASTDYYQDQGRGACGAWRTYVRCERLDFSSIAAAYRAGRTFATNGPLVLFRVAGAEPGDEVALAQEGEVVVSLWAESQWGVEAAEVVVNGEVAQRWEASGGRIEVAERLRLDETSWLAARVFGPKSAQVDTSPMADEPGQFCGQFAHTSPVYVTIGGAPFRPRRGAVEFCLRWVEAMERATLAAREKYLSADLSAYGVTGAEALEQVIARIAQVKEIARRLRRKAR